jgi:polygalacturonase
MATPRLKAGASSSDLEEVMGSRRRFFSSLAAGAAASAVSGSATAAAVSGAAAAGRAWLFDVTAHGAVGDGLTLTTAALQRAIDACVRAGGGMVLVPPGRYLTGTLFLGSNVELHLCAGAILLASERFDDFPAIDGRFEGIERKIHAALLTGERLENVSITGGGLIDGQGASWWEAFDVTQKMRIARGLTREAPNPPEAPLRYACPSLITLIRCQRVRIAGIAFENSPLWNVNLAYCQDAVVDGVSMVGLHSQMSCGVYIDSCKRVQVTGSAIASGSDCIGLKAGYNEDGRRVGIPCEDIIISNCHLYDSFASGVAIGSETAAGIKNVTISNCVIENCRAAFYLRSTRGRGGGIERVRVSGCIAEGVRDSVIIVRPFWDSVRSLGYTAAPGPRNTVETDRETSFPVNDGTPTFRDLDFSGISVGTTNSLAVIEGLPERFIQNVSIDQVSVTHTRLGVSCRNVAGLHLGRLRLDPHEGPLVSAHNIEHLAVGALFRGASRSVEPMVELENVAAATIDGCPGADPVRLRGSANRDVVIAGARPALAEASPPPPASRRR